MGFSLLKSQLTPTGEYVLAKHPFRAATSNAMEVSLNIFFILALQKVFAIYSRIQTLNIQYLNHHPPPVQSGFLSWTGIPVKQLTPTGDIVLAPAHAPNKIVTVNSKKARLIFFILTILYWLASLSQGIRTKSGRFL
jgi:hypothetical protein